MKLNNYIELSSIQGELEGLAIGMGFEEFNKKECIKALKELAKKLKQIRKEETYEH